MYLYVIVYFSLIFQTCQADGIVMTLKYSKHRVKPVVVNGEPATRGLVPYIVSIKYSEQTGRNTYKYMSICGGTIVGPRKVVTAAHCFASKGYKYAKDPSPLAVVAGDLRNVIDTNNVIMTEETQWRKVSSLLIHPNYNFPFDDIALVFVDEDWTFSRTVAAAKLAVVDTDYPDACYVAGYGRIGLDKYAPKSDILRVAKIDVLSRENCTYIWKMSMDEFVCSLAVTADVAMGDSGGPLVCRSTTDPAEEPDKALLVGVTSGKNYDSTTLFTRVSAYSKWINKHNVGKSYSGCDLLNWCWSTYLLSCVLIIIVC